MTTPDVRLPDPSIDIPADFASRSTATYRFWFFTAPDDPRGSKGSVAVCLHGALGSVWLQQLQQMRPSGTLRQGVINADAHGGRCELFVAAQDVGTIQRLTVAYAHGGKEDAGAKPWKLAQIIVRHGSDGVCTTFPANVEMRPPDALLELMPRLTYHEDMWGNLLQAPPPPPPGGRWSWPASHLLANPEVLPSNDAGAASELEALSLKLYHAILNEEVLPLADAALNDVRMMRTPGSFLFDVVSAAAGTASGDSAAPSAMEALRKHSAKLQYELDVLSGKKKKVVGTNEQNAAVRHQNDLDAMKRRIKMLEERNRLLSEAVKNKEAMNASGGDDEGMEGTEGAEEERGGTAKSSMFCAVS